MSTEELPIKNGFVHFQKGLSTCLYISCILYASWLKVHRIWTLQILAVPSARSWGTATIKIILIGAVLFTYRWAEMSMTLSNTWFSIILVNCGVAKWRSWRLGCAWQECLLKFILQSTLAFICVCWRENPRVKRLVYLAWTFPAYILGPYRLWATMCGYVVIWTFGRWLSQHAISTEIVRWWLVVCSISSDFYMLSPSSSHSDPTTLNSGNIAFKNFWVLGWRGYEEQPRRTQRSSFLTINHINL